QLRVMEARQGARGRWKGQRYGPVLQGQGVCGGACTVRGEQVDAVTATPQGIGQSEGALCGGHRGGEQQDLRHASSVLRAASSGGGVVRGGWRSNSRETCSAIPIITTSIAAIAAPSTVRVVISSQGAKYSNPRGTAAKNAENTSILPCRSVTTKTVEIGEVTSCIASQGVSARAMSPAMSHCGPSSSRNSHGAVR